MIQRKETPPRLSNQRAEEETERAVHIRIIFILRQNINNRRMYVACTQHGVYLP